MNTPTIRPLGSESSVVGAPRSAFLAATNVLLSSAIVFLLYGYIVKRLGTADLGLWSLVVATTSATRMSEFGFSGSATKYVAKFLAMDDTDAAVESIQTATITVALFAGFLGAAFFPLGCYLVLQIVPAEKHEAALSLLPWALVTVVVGMVASAIQSGLDGCRRIELRIYVSLASQIVLLFCTVLLVPTFGLNGLVYSQVIQAVVLAVGSWFALRVTLKGLPYLPTKWSKNRFREMLFYGLSFQLNALFLFLLDPVTKMLLTHFGSLSATGHFEMANQMIQKVRQLLVSANQSLVPYIATAVEQEPSKVLAIHRVTTDIVTVAVLAMFTCLCAAAPLASWLWIGSFQSLFVTMICLLSFGWGANTLSAPTYFVNLGIGRLRSNTFGHAAMAIVNLALGAALGAVFGAFGVVGGMSAALAVGSAFILLGSPSSSTALILGSRPAWTLFGISLCGTFCMCIMLLSLFTDFYLIGTQTLLLATGKSAAAVTFICYLLVISLYLARHPGVQPFFKHLFFKMHNWTQSNDKSQ